MSGSAVERVGRGPGHSVLAVPVPALEEFVRERTAYYDASFLSSDPCFAHAHVTVLGPWLSAPGADDLERVAHAVAQTEGCDVRWEHVATFPDGVIHLRPDPVAPFAELTARLSEAFPECPPYEGRHPDPVPHLTLDRRGPGVSADSVCEELAALLPVTVRAERVDLQWWGNHACRRLDTWELSR